MEAEKNFFSAKRITGLAVLLALVILLQFFGSSIPVGTTSLSFVLVPIVLGGILYGAWAGALLGFVFGLIVLISGISGSEAFTATLFNAHPFITSLVCLGKGTVAGFGAGLVFHLVSKKNAYVGVFAASAIAPILNTGLFILGALFMSDTLSGMTGGTSVIYFLAIVCAGVNFLVELAVNLICSPAIYTVLRVVSKGKIK